MLNSTNMKKSVILFKPSGTIAISGDLTEIQRKFYDGLLYNIKKDIENNGDKNFFNVALSDLKKLLNANEQNKNNVYYKKQLKKLSKIQIEYNILGKDKTIEGFANLITEGEFITNKETGEILFKYNIPTRVKEAIKSKKGLFAKIDLMIKKNLKHRYSLILYDLIKDYEDVEIPEMTITEFRKIFGIENKYKLFQDLKKRVLEPAIEDINNNEKIDFIIEYKLTKRGSKYTHIKFIKKRKPILKKLEQERTKKLETGKVDVLLGQIPEEYRKSIKNFLSEIIHTYPIDYLETQINYTNYQNPKNYIAYLKTAIKEDYAGFQEIKEKEKEKKEKEKELNKLRKKIEELEERKKILEEEAEKEFENLNKEEKERLINENMIFINDRNIARITAIGKIINKKIKEYFSKEEIKLLNLKDKI